MLKWSRVLFRRRISTWCLSKEEAQAASMLLQAIDKSYVQLSEVVEVEVIIII